jgi:hypothetical protein
LLVIFPFVNRTSDAISSEKRPYWYISGEVALVDEIGRPIQASQASNRLEKMVVSTVPNMLGRDGAVLRFKVPEEDGSLPSIFLTFPDTWKEKRLDFPEPPPWWMFWKWWEHTDKRDNLSRTIKLGKVSIEREPPLLEPMIRYRRWIARRADPGSRLIESRICEMYLRWTDPSVLPR